MHRKSSTNLGLTLNLVSKIVPKLALTLPWTQPSLFKTQNSFWKTMNTNTIQTNNWAYVIIAKYSKFYWDVNSKWHIWMLWVFLNFGAQTFTCHVPLTCSRFCATSNQGSSLNASGCRVLYEMGFIPIPETSLVRWYRASLWMEEDSLSAVVTCLKPAPLGHGSGRHFLLDS